MPYAARKRRETLNRSYAFVASARFDEAARALKDGLVLEGFEKQEAAELVIEQTLLLGNTTTPAVPSEPVTVTLPCAPIRGIPVSVIELVSWDATSKTLRIDLPLDYEQETALVDVFSDEKAKVLVADACRRRSGKSGTPWVPQLSPSQRGELFAVPVLAFKQGDFHHQFGTDDIDDRMEWSLSEADAELETFFIPTGQQGVEIDIADNEKLQQNFLPLSDAQYLLFNSSVAWSVGVLVQWLDRFFAHSDITEAEMGIYLTRIVGKLLDDHKMSLETLTAHRYRLGKAIIEKVAKLRQEARRKVLEEMLFTEASAPVFVSSAQTHLFEATKYPYTYRYSGLVLPKHFYEVVGNLKNSGEEYDCARFISDLQDIEFWVRNLEAEPDSAFWIQTSTDKFYPDFVCKLKNGKYLVVEYKGAHLADNADSLEKERLGQLWEARSAGQCLFLMVKGPAEIPKIARKISQS